MKTPKGVNKLFFILIIPVLGFFFLIPRNLNSEDAGYKYLKNYSYKEYDHLPQNWGMAQAKNGIIYVANLGGVLEFDGVSWRIIYIPNKTVYSLAIDEKGVVYIGGQDEIGYLAPDKKGTLNYVSLVSRLDEKFRNFSYVWSVQATKEGIYFRAANYLFRLNSKKEIKVFSALNSFKSSFVCKGDFIVQELEKGLLKMENDSLKLISGAAIFLKEKIYLLEPYDAQTMLIGTRSKGFYLYDGKTAKPFPTEVDGYLKNNFSYGTRLSSGDFAIATINNGLIIMSPNGRLKHIFDKAYGIQDDSVKYAFEDNQGNLWLCLENGISKIEYTSPLTIYDARSNLPGIILSVIKHKDDLYVGTTKGLYYRESSFKFRLITSVPAGCFSLLSIENSILAATSQGVFQVEKNVGTKVIDNPSFVLLSSKHNADIVWCGTSTGLVALCNEKGRWKEKLKVGGADQEIRSIAEDKKGNLWLGNSIGSVVKVDVEGGIDHLLIQRFSIADGLPGGQINVADACGRVIFASEKGIYRFDEKDRKFTFDQTLGKEFAGGSKPVFLLVEDKNKNIWFSSESRNYQAIRNKEGDFTIHSTPLRRIPTIQVNAIYPDPDGKTTWFASNDGLIRYDTTQKKNYRQNFQTLVRKILVNEMEIFDGIKNKTGQVAGVNYPAFNYKERNIRFEFAAPYFEDETRTQYRCLLEGYDKKWSKWDKETKRIYTNLDPGRYTFHVQAENVYEYLGSEDTYRFRILPPWYKTWWAYLIYGVGFFLSIYLTFKWRESKLEKEKQRLEEIVTERTKEIQEKNKQLENQTVKLQEQSEKLKEMDKVKSRFFANISHEFRTPLTLIMSPLEQMLSDSRDKKQKESFKVMLRSSRQLLTLINQLLDLSRFDSGKIKLQTTCRNIVSFLKGVMASFHMLADQNKLELEFQAEEEEILLYIDSPKMEEVMYNLLINAVKFTPSGSKITVSVSKDPQEKGNTQPEEGPAEGFVKISVRDTGIGIPKDQLPHIFDRFYQAKNVKERGRKGTGIGLAITKEIVLLHQGKIDVHSQEEKGTEFVIQLPIGCEHLKQDEILVVPGTESDRIKTGELEPLYNLPTEEEVDSDTAENGGVENKPAPETKTEAQEKDVILVVEDNADVRKYIREPLEPYYTVVEAGDGKEGIEKAKELIPDLIVSDIMMPEVDGYELCETLKKDIATSHIPIILLTAKASEESIIQGLETGADDYVTKPFNSKILLTRIKNLIDLRAQLHLKLQREKMRFPSEITVSSMDEKFLKEFRGIIDKNLADPEFNVDKLSDKLYMGRSTLFKKIKALTGETPNQFIMSYRLERAAQLLRENFGNVTDVAFAVGFNSSTYFATCFKEKFEQSPSTYHVSESKTS